MRLLFVLAAFVATPAIAETTYVISVSNRVTPVQPSATVEVWAIFDESLEAFAGAVFEFSATPDAGGFSDPQRLLTGPGTQDGVVDPDGDSVNGIISGQLCFPVIEWPPDPSNPILIWRVTWSTDQFDRREVHLATARVTALSTSSTSSAS
jgi:hypothetical protein